MTKILAYLPGGEERSQLPRQAGTASQRDSWLRHMEQAKVAEASRPGADNLSGEDTNKPALTASWSPLLHRRPINAMAALQIESESLQPHPDAMPASAQPDSVSTAQTSVIIRAPTQNHKDWPSGEFPELKSQSKFPLPGVRIINVADTVSEAQVLPEQAAVPVAAVTSVKKPSDVHDTTPEILFSLDVPNVSDAKTASVATNDTAAPEPCAVTVPRTLLTATLESCSAHWHAAQINSAEPVSPAPHVEKKAGSDSPHAEFDSGDQSSGRVATRVHAAINHAIMKTADEGRVKENSPDTAILMTTSMPIVGIVSAQAGVNLQPSAQSVMSTSQIQPLQSRVPIAAAALTALAGNIHPELPHGEPEASLDMAQEEPSAAKPSLQEKQTWQKRLMHLTGEGDDLKLWIRDSKLTEIQSQSLINRLASDIAGMGMRLMDATVNGKSAFGSGADDDETSRSGTKVRARRAALPGAGSLGAQHAIDLINSPLEEEHGPQ